MPPIFTGSTDCQSACFCFRSTVTVASKFPSCASVETCAYAARTFARSVASLLFSSCDANTGIAIAISTAMSAMTISISINVNPLRFVSYDPCFIFDRTNTWCTHHELLFLEYNTPLLKNKVIK